MTKHCAKCKRYLPVGDFTRDARMISGLKSYCRTCCATDAVERYHAEPERARAAARDRARKARTPETTRNKHLRDMYGLTREQYDALLAEQGGGCAVCKADKASGKGSFHVDHDHDTGAVRGLLCHHCNIAIGNAGDDPARLRALADYLDRTRARSATHDR